MIPEIVFFLSLAVLLVFGGGRLYYYFRLDRNTKKLRKKRSCLEATNKELLLVWIFALMIIVVRKIDFIARNSESRFDTLYSAVILITFTVYSFAVFAYRKKVKKNTNQKTP